MSTKATQLLSLGRNAEAIPLLQQEAILQPENSAIQHDLGLACLKCGMLDDAIAALRRAVAINPKFARAHLRLGVALEMAGKPAAAAAAYQRAAALLPSLTEAVFRAANLLEAQGRPDEALALFRRGGATRPKTALGRVCEARALIASGQDADALRVLRQAVAADASNALAQELLGTVLAEAGEFEAARVAFKRAIAAAPILSGSYYEMARCRKMGPDDAAEVAEMQAALRNPRVTPDSRQRIHLALGKAAADAGNHAEAMRQYDAADAARQEMTGFDAGKFSAQADRIITQFTPSFIAGLQACGHTSSMPILVLGMPRSGTTLVQQILARHKDVAAAGEMQFWQDRGAQWAHEETQANFDAASFINQAGADYLKEMQKIAAGKAHVSDKMPFNFLWAGLIHAALPNAMIIHCRRAPVATALSIHQTHFNPRFDFPTGGASLVAYYRAYQRLMAHWRAILPPGLFHEIDYETLTATPGPVIEELLRVCGLAWDEACLHPEQHRGVVKTPSKWQTRQPIYGTSANAWKSYEAFLGPLQALVD